jgi:dTDP-4-dehydrorhamnose reductase
VTDAAAAIGADVLYVSNDAVFSSDGTLKSEVSIPSPVWDYGAWKLEAETAVLASSKHDDVVRLPLVVSLDPLDAAAEQIAQGAARTHKTEWYQDEFRQPAMASEIAEGMWLVLSSGPRRSRRRIRRRTLPRAASRLSNARH